MSLLACEVLLNLVPSLQVEILSKWLTLKEVVRLDSALCSTQHRDLFQTILDEDYCVFPAGTTKSDYFHNVWVCRRRIKVSSFNIPRGFSSAIYTYFEVTGKHVQWLDISHMIECTPIADTNTAVLKLLRSCVNLRVLELPGTDSNKFDLSSALPILPGLLELNLTYCKNVSGELLYAINKYAKNLQTLILSNAEMCNHMSAEPFPENHTIRTIVKLNLRGTPFPISFILHCKALHTICIGQTDMDDIFAVLTQCPALRILSAYVRYLPNRLELLDQHLNTLTPLIQKLHALHLYHNYNVRMQDEQVLRLIANSPGLSALLLTSISYPENTVKTMLDIATHAQPPSANVHALQQLRVEKISSATLQSILNICPLLTSLRCMSRCDEEDQRSLMSTIGSSSIKSVHFSSCERFKSSDVLFLHDLTSLTLTYWYSMTHEDVVGIVTHNPLLRKLSLTECPLINRKSLMYIVEKCTHLEELVFSNVDSDRRNPQSVDTALAVELIHHFRPKMKKLSLKMQ